MESIINQSGKPDHSYSGLEPLLAEPFWINYRLGKRDDGKLIKEPHNGSYRIDPHKPEHHLTFLEAKRLISFGFRIGFVTSMGHDFVAIDLDHCVNEKGELNSFATGLISQFGTYAEFSPSGRGIHLWLRVKNKNSPEMKALLARKRITDRIEIYGYGQFVTITGNPVPRAPLTIRDATEQLLDLYKRYPVQHAVSQEIDWNDQPVTQKSREEILEIIYNGKNGKTFKILHETGDASLTDLQPNDDGKFDQSKIEAFYFHNILEAADEDPRMALELFTQSALFRDKSSDPRGGISYAEYSIGRILGGRLATQMTEQSTPTTTTLPEWPSEPTLLGSYKADKTDAPHLTSDLLPANLSEYVMDEAKRLNVYPEMIAMPLVAALGVTVGSRIAVKPKAKDNWYEYPNLWGYVAAPPGSRKSEAIRSGFAFMKELATQAQKRNVAREIAYRQQLDAYKEKLKESKKKSKDAD